MTHLRSFAGVLAVAGAAGLNLFVGDPAAADPPGDLTLGQEPDPTAVSISTPEVLEGTGLRPVVAVAVAFGAIRLLRGWHLRRQT